MRTIDEVSAQIGAARLFTTLDAKSGFLQLKVDEPSLQLTTFNTPFGHYQRLRLPLGIKSAPEIYQRIMDTKLKGISNAIAVMDDILVWGTSRGTRRHTQESPPACYELESSVKSTEI